MTESVAIVSGASQGIGRATAIRLTRDFSALVLVARNRSNLEHTAEAVESAGAKSRGFTLPVTSASRRRQADHRRRRREDALPPAEPRD